MVQHQRPNPSRILSQAAFPLVGSPWQRGPRWNDEEYREWAAARECDALYHVGCYWDNGSTTQDNSAAYLKIGPLQLRNEFPVFSDANIQRLANPLFERLSDLSGSANFAKNQILVLRAWEYLVHEIQFDVPMPTLALCQPLIFEGNSHELAVAVAMSAALRDDPRLFRHIVFSGTIDFASTDLPIGPIQALDEKLKLICPDHPRGREYQQVVDAVYSDPLIAEISFGPRERRAEPCGVKIFVTAAMTTEELRQAIDTGFFDVEECELHLLLGDDREEREPPAAESRPHPRQLEIRKEVGKVKPTKEASDGAPLV